MAMYNDKTSTTSLKEMLKSMAENSSIHGVSRWVTSKYWYQRVLWILVFLGATGGMSYQLSLLFKSFRSYPVKASVDLRFSSLPFPAVSLCNMNPIKLSKLSLTNKDTQNVINVSISERERESKQFVKRFMRANIFSAMLDIFIPA